MTVFDIHEPAAAVLYIARYACQDITRPSELGQYKLGGTT